MLKSLQLLLAGIAVVALTTAVSARPDDKEKKEVTLKGDVCCAKCELKMADKCATVVRVKESGKDVIYYFDDASAKKFHKEICTEAKAGTVTGKVSEKDGKKVITVTKVEFKDKDKGK
jgi:RecG-like helicase